MAGGATAQGLPTRCAFFSGVSVAVLAFALASAPAWSQQLPTGGSVAAGSASIAQPNANTLNINQSTNQAIINWQSFSVGQGGTVNFNQPSSSSATLNRVLGSTPSSIAGMINAPGTVLLVNPNGIAITKSGVINTGSFAASTLDIKDADFLAGNYKFTGNGGSAAVKNAGRINVSDGGFAALLGGQVANSGVISARLGKVGLGAGELITLDFAGDGFLSVAVPSTHLGNLVDANGALVTNSGRIRADGGQVFLTAATASTILRDAVNVPGAIRANTVGTRDGKIVIGGGAGGKVNVTGRLAAKSKTGKGGDIAVTGKDIKLASANIDASGKTGGGNVNIGGSWQGQGPLQRAETVTIDATTTIKADAIKTGDGGNIVVWSDGLTSVAGTLSALGANGGLGGFIETSGHTLSIAGARVSTGRGGQWLLDPYDLTVDAAAAAAINFALNDGTGTDVTLQTTASGSSGPGVVNPAGVGDITVANALSWDTTAKLTLDAYRGININASITITGGGKLALNAAYDTTTVVGKSLLQLYFASGASLSYAESSPGSGTGIAGQALTINGDSYNLIYSLAGIQSLTTAAGRRDALALSLTATGTYGGYVYDNIYRGTFEGLGNTIADLKINSSGGAAVFRSIESSGTLRNFGVVGASVFNNSAGYTGSLAGQNYGIVANVFSSATLNSDTSTGGLLGANYGAGALIVNSYFTGSVNTDTGGGGITGTNEGTVSRSFSSGAIRATSGFAGGLVGTNSDTFGNGTIIDSYATGRVTATLGNGGGGLVALNDTNAQIINSYWDVETTGRPISDRDSKVSAATYGLTTADFQNGGASGLAPVFGGGAGGLYPYLKTFFPNGVQAITGTIYSDAGVTAAPSGLGGAVTVKGLVDGINIGNATTGANGYYYLFAPVGTVSGSGSQIVVSSTGLVNGGATQQQDATNSLSGLNIFGTYLKQQTTGNALSSVSNSLTTALGTNSLPSYANRQIDITASNFAIDQALTVTGTLNLFSSNGGISQTQPITAGTLNVTTPVADVTLNNFSNNVTSIGGVNVGAGNFTLFSGTSTLTVGSVDANLVNILNFSGDVSVLGPVTAGANGANLSAQGSLSVAGTITSNGGNVFLEGQSVEQTGSGSTITGEKVTLFADDLTLRATITATAPNGAVVLAPKTFGRTVTLGDTVAAAGLVIDNSELAFINASMLNIGTAQPFNIPPNIQAGSILVGAATVQNNTLNLFATGGVTQDGLLNVNGGNGTLTVMAGGTVALDSAGVSAANVGGSTSSGDFRVLDTSPMTVTGITNSGSGDVVLLADSMTITGTVSAAAIYIAPATAGAAVTIGDSSAPVGLVLDNNSLSQLDANAALNIGKVGASGPTVADSIVIGQAIVNNGTLNLFTTGGVTMDNALGMTVGGGTGTLNVTAGATVNLTVSGLGGIAVGTVSGSTTNGNFLVNGGNGSLAVGAAGIVTTNGGEIVVRNFFGNLSVGGALTSNGGNILVGSNNSSGSGLTIAADIDAGYGSIGLFGANGGISQTAGTLTGNYLLAVVTGSIGGITLVGNNHISGNVRLNAGANGGDISFANAGGFTLGGFTGILYSSLGAILAPTASAALSTAGTATLTAGGDIDQAGFDDAIVADTFIVQRLNSANPNVMLDGFNNVITNLGAVTLGQGAFTLYNTGDLTITDAATAGGGYKVITEGFLTQNAGANIDTSRATSGRAFDGAIELAGVGGGCGCGGGSPTDLILNANLNAGTGGIVRLGATGNITQFGGAITAASVTAEVDTGSVSLNSATNSFAAIDGASELDFSAITSVSLTIGLTGSGAVFSNAGSVNLTALGATNDIVVDGGAVVASGTVSLAAGQDILVSGCGCGFIAGNDVLLAASRDIVVDGVVTAYATATLTAGRDLTLAANAFISGGDTGDAIFLSAAGKFVNNAGAGVLDMPGGGRWLIYSNNPADNTFGGLDSGNTAIWGTTYPALPPAVATGNRYLFAETATLVLSPDDASKIYGDLVTLTYSASGLKSGYTDAFLGDTLASVLSGAPALSSTGEAAAADAGVYAINIATGTAVASNGYALSVTGTAQLTVTPATLVFTAAPASRPSGQPNPPLIGTIGGFKLGQTAATFGGDIWSTLADNNSPGGSYAILGDLLGASPNYIKVQAAGNATALTVTAPIPNNSPSQVTPPSNNPAGPGVNVAFQNVAGGPINVSFTPSPRTASNNPGTDVSPASLPDGAALATNNGMTFLPISMYDANQYSQFVLPNYADQASLSAVFTMIARGVDAQRAPNYMIDTFWDGTTGAWKAGDPNLSTKVTFSDGQGNAVAPTGQAGFPIVAGSTDFAQLLKTGPVMISGGGNPASWLLATQITADGKGIVANDPATGKQVVLSYDAATKTVGGVTGVFDANSKKFVSFADAGISTPALTALQSFVPATFLAITAK